ncbi:MAG: efflux RND transporter periplasmic adaptor subunit [Myxococcota bacterium]
MTHAARRAGEALRASQARLELARRDHARTEELYRSGVAAQQRLDEATAELRSAQAEVAGRRKALEQARAAASFTEIRAPVAGRVVDRLAEPGDTAVPGRPLLRIYDPALLRVEAPVRESLAVRLRVGDPLRVDIPVLGEPVEGRIDEIVPFAERIPGGRGPGSLSPSGRRFARASRHPPGRRAQPRRVCSIQGRSAGSERGTGAAWNSCV